MCLISLLIQSRLNSYDSFAFIQVDIKLLIVFLSDIKQTDSISVKHLNTDSPCCSAPNTHFLHNTTRWIQIYYLGFRCPSVGFLAIRQNEIEFSITSIENNRLQVVVVVVHLVSR